MFAMMAPSPGGGDGGMIQTMVMMGAVVLIFYFMMIRPQQKRQKEHQALLNAIKPGDKVITASGMHGSVYQVDEKTITITVASNVHLTFDKSAIATVVAK